MAQQTKNNGNAKQKPEMTIRCGRIKAAIWANKKRNDKGEEVTRHNVTLSKSYKDKESDEWQEFSISLFPEELWKVEAVLRQAQTALSLEIKR